MELKIKMRRTMNRKKIKRRKEQKKNQKILLNIYFNKLIKKKMFSLKTQWMRSFKTLFSQIQIQPKGYISSLKW